jgi:hypothetical protein
MWDCAVGFVRNHPDLTEPKTGRWRQMVNIMGSHAGQKPNAGAALEAIRHLKLHQS